MNQQLLPLLLPVFIAPAYASGSGQDPLDGNARIRVGGSIEIEHERERSVFHGIGPRESSESTVGTLQLEVEASSSTEAGIRILLELDTDEEDASAVDEAYLFMERDAFAASAGRLYVPFGRFDSLFATDAFTEFAEIRATALSIEFRPVEMLALEMFLIDGRIDAGGAPDTDYGASIELSPPGDAWRLGAAYVSDIAEARDLPFDLDGRRTARRVAAWNLFAGFAFGDFELLLEAVAADRFEELDASFDQPAAGTFELIYRPRERFAIAARVEASRELGDAPRRRYGISARWYVSEYFAVGMDVLSGRFDDDDEPVDGGDTPAGVDEVRVQLQLEF